MRGCVRHATKSCVLVVHLTRWNDVTHIYTHTHTRKRTHTADQLTLRCCKTDACARNKISLCEMLYGRIIWQQVYDCCNIQLVLSSVVLLMQNLVTVVTSSVISEAFG
jgi:hypothetical protein